MEKIRSVVDIVDIAVKVVITTALFLLYGTAKEQALIDKVRADALASQATALHTIADTSKSKQEANLVVVDKILNIFAEIHKQCLNEETSFFLDFLVQINNSYNDVKLDSSKLGPILSAQATCTTSGGQTDVNAKVVQQENNGVIPFVDQQNIQRVQKQLSEKGVTVATTSNDSHAPAPDGYVAVGIFDAASKSFRNFVVKSGTVDPDGGIKPEAVLTARWSVYLRANTQNTDTGGNPIIGLIKEGDCVKVISAFPNTRGQTWAAVSLSCG